MKSITIPSIDSLLESAKVRAVLLITQQLERYKEEWNHETRNYETRLKLRNREDAFLSRLAQRGIRVSPALMGDVTETFITQTGPFDIGVVAGEITYQSFAIARRLTERFPALPLFVEFCETTFDTQGAKILAKNARYYECEYLLERLVYITSVAKSPRSISIPI